MNSYKSVYGLLCVGVSIYGLHVETLQVLETRNVRTCT